MKRIGFGILIGLLTTVLLSVATDLFLERIEFFPPAASGKMNFNHSLLFVASIYRAIYGILGGLVTALIAKERFWLGATLLGIIGTIISFVGMIMMWGKSTPWYPISLVILALPYTLIGAKIYELYIQKLLIKDSKTASEKLAPVVEDKSNQMSA